MCKRNILEGMKMTLIRSSRIAKPRYFRKTMIVITLLTSLLLIWMMLNRPTYHDPNAEFTEFPKQPFNYSTENPGKHLNYHRFDIVIKVVYAYYYIVYDFVPDVLTSAYIEHLKVWNNVTERCGNLHPETFDAKLPCKNKTNGNDFISSFQSTINSIRKHGFKSDMSIIPTDKNGDIINGAHRLAAAIVLSKDPTFEYFDFDTAAHNGWDYSFFKKKGMQSYTIDLIMLEWMQIQLKLPQVSSKVFIMSVFSDSRCNDDSVRKIVSQKCAHDKGILYEKIITVTKFGMSQLVRHMYGNQEWLPGKIKDMLSLFTNAEFTVVFMFFFGKSIDEMRECKYEVRKLYNHQSFKSTAHIPDSPEESLILAEMVLNTNSIQFLNHGINGLDCLEIAKELAARMSLKTVPTLPDLYIGREDIIFDSGSVMHLFDLRKRTDVDILFLYDIDKRVLGNRNGVNIEAHAFKENAIDQGRPWGEDHFSGIVKSKWDLFYDGNNFGFCYGIKFVSLRQLVRYKLKRNEPIKDARDINLIFDFILYLLSSKQNQSLQNDSLWDCLKIRLGF